MIEFRHKYSWARNLIFSLLKGRPVVIWAYPANEGAVRTTIATLAIFVAGLASTASRPPSPVLGGPGRSHAGSHSVLPWRVRGLKMSDLASLKLTGLSKQFPIPKAVDKYITVFDFENETLKSPPYSPYGRFIDDILSLKKLWPDEWTYLAHIHQILLDIAIKSCLYYHLCCVGVPQAATVSSPPASHPHSPTSSPTSPSAAQTPQNSYITSRDSSASTPSIMNSGSRRSTVSGSRLVRHNSLQYNKAIGSQSHRSLSDSHINPALFPVPAAVRDLSRSTFYRQMDIMPGDTDIVEYFAEVVKEQQAAELQGSESISPVIRLDYTPCQTFKNSFKK